MPPPPLPRSPLLFKTHVANLHNRHDIHVRMYPLYIRTPSNMDTSPAKRGVLGKREHHMVLTAKNFCLFPRGVLPRECRAM